MKKTVTRATGNRRLLKLADFLEKLSRKRFDYSCWVGEDWEGKQDLSCGTTACALGWATTIPSFRRVGLRLVAGDVRLRLVAGDVQFGRGVWGTDAAEKFFGITADQAENIFARQHQIDMATTTPKMVAGWIRRLVKSRER